MRWREICFCSRVKEGEEDILEWQEKWKSPLPDGTACGAEDMTFTPEFEALQAEVNKNDGLRPDERTDWDLVLEMSTALLAARTKDVWVLCWGCRAVFEQNGLQGLVPALDILAGYLDRHWDELYPSARRPARRTAPLLWLIAKFERLLPADAFPAEKDETYTALRETLRHIQAVVDERLGDNAPSFRAIIRAVPEPRAAEPKKETPVPPPDLSQLLAGLDGDGRVPDSILPQLLRATTQQTQQLAVHYLAQDATDWRAYLLHRAGLWGTVPQLPTATSENVTPLRPVVSRDKAASYKAAVDGRQYAAILPQLEKSASKAPFWLDGQRLVARCLEGLGADGALFVVRALLCRFIHCFPQLLDYKFFDGTPFASPDTRQWIEDLRQREAHKDDEPVLTGDAQQVQYEEALLRQALAAYEETQNFDKGLEALGAAPGGRTRAAVTHGLLQARYCLRAGKPKAGKELLLSLYDRLEAWDLLDWEPELSAKIVSLLITTGGDKGNGAMRRRLYWIQADTAIKFSE